MAIEVLMPEMSEDDDVGRLARWLVAPGDVVHPGDLLAEIETETATIEIEAVDSGRIARILIASGTDAVAAGTPIALIEPKGQAIHQMAYATHAATSNSPIQLRSHTNGRMPGRIKASPFARKQARKAGVPLDELDGSGPGGRIIAKDVAAGATVANIARDAGKPAFDGGRSSGTPVLAMRHPESEASENRQLAYVTTSLSGARDDTALIRQAYAPGSYVARSHDPRRHTVLDRLSMAHTHVPQITLHADVRLDELQHALQRMNSSRSVSGRRSYTLSASDVLVKAMGLALRNIEEANVSFTRSAMLYHGVVDVAVALLPDIAGDFGPHQGDHDFEMVAPVVAHADLKSLSEISQEAQVLRDLARSGHLDPSEVRGGVTTIFDFSGSSISGCETLVMPPQSSVLVLGAAEAKAVVIDGEVAVRPCASLSLTVDQRAIDTGVAIRLLTAVKAYVEDPMRMLV